MQNIQIFLEIYTFASKFFWKKFWNRKLGITERKKVFFVYLCCSFKQAWQFQAVLFILGKNFHLFVWPMNIIYEGYKRGMGG